MEINYIIVLHDHFEGCNDIANPKGQIFHPKGRRWCRPAGKSTLNWPFE